MTRAICRPSWVSVFVALFAALFVFSSGVDVVIKNDLPPLPHSPLLPSGTPHIPLSALLARIRNEEHVLANSPLFSHSSPPPAFHPPPSSPFGGLFNQFQHSSAPQSQPVGGGFPGLGMNSNGFNNIEAATALQNAAVAGGVGALGAPPVKEIIADAKSCEFELDGDSYDFRRLVRKEGSPEYVAQDTHNNIYKLNFCDVVTTPGSDCQRANGMICQYRSSMSGLSLEGVISRFHGKPTPQWGFIDPNNRGAGVKLVMMNGDDCLVRGQRRPRQSVVFFVCDESVGVLGQISSQEVETCSYMFTVPTNLACSDSAGLSGGWIFIILLFFFVVAYIILGCIYNRIKNSAQGMAAFPNLELWQELPGLVKDGCQYTMTQVGCVKPKTDDDI